MTRNVWTSREVRFEVYPRQAHHVESLMDALVEHYWERTPRTWWMRRFIEPGVASCERTVTVAGIPWWMPPWWARRTVANIAHANRIGGNATFVVERTVLVG